MKDEAERYRLLLESRRWRGPRPLDALSPGAVRRQAQGQEVWSPLGAVLGRATRQLRRRTLAAEAWERNAPPGALPGSVVEAVEGDTVVIAVENATVCYELRRQARTLARNLAKLVPGVSRIRFTVAGVAPQEPPGAV